jgi:hypothetical protein
MVALPTLFGLIGTVGSPLVLVVVKTWASLSVSRLEPTVFPHLMPIRSRTPSP